MSEQVYEKPLVITYSGGKDSDVLLRLAMYSNINFEVNHSHTTIDAPETVYHVRNTFRQCELKGISCSILMPKYKRKPVTMWNLIPQKGFPPTRFKRYCCEVLKETSGKKRFIATGVRWAESARRRATRGIYEKPSLDKNYRIILSNDNDDRRRLFEHCHKLSRRAVNPIVDWSDSDVWDFLSAEKIQVNPLYQCGMSRVGCIGCPLAGKARVKEFERYPTYVRAYKRAFDQMLRLRKVRNGGKSFEVEDWKTADEVFDWWMSK